MLFAVDPALTYTPPAAPPAPDPVGLLLRLLGLMAVCLALCGVVLWLARKKLKPAAAAANGRIVLTGSVPLDRRSAVHFVTVDGTPVAVTTDQTGVREIRVLNGGLLS